MSRRNGFSIPTVRRSLCRSARILGDIQAVRTGRISRRTARRGLGKLLGRTLVRGLFRQGKTQNSQPASSRSHLSAKVASPDVV